MIFVIPSCILNKHNLTDRKREKESRRKRSRSKERKDRKDRSRSREKRREKRRERSRSREKKREKRRSTERRFRHYYTSSVSVYQHSILDCPSPNQRLVRNRQTATSQWVIRQKIFWDSSGMERWPDLASFSQLLSPLLDEFVHFCQNLKYFSNRASSS